MKPMHPSADQLAALAAGALEPCERPALWEHLAECQTCRDCLFLLAKPAKPRRLLPGRSARFVWAAVAASLLVATCGSVVYRKRTTPPPQFSGTASSLPKVFTYVSLTSRHNPQPNQFVLQTASGERWITFERAKLFNRE